MGREAESIRFHLSYEACPASLNCLQAAADALGELEELKERLSAAEDSLTSQQDEASH